MGSIMNVEKILKIKLKELVRKIKLIELVRIKFDTHLPPKPSFSLALSLNERFNDVIEKIGACHCHQFNHAKLKPIKTLQCLPSWFYDQSPYHTRRSILIEIERQSWDCRDCRNAHHHNLSNQTIKLLYTWRMRKQSQDWMTKRKFISNSRLINYNALPN